MGEQFTEDVFEQYQRDFHRKQLRPFASVLGGKHLKYLQELQGEAESPISDDDYWVVGESKGGVVRRRSPRAN